MKTRDSQIQPPCSCFTLGAPLGVSPVCIRGVAWGFLHCMTIMSSNIKPILAINFFGVIQLSTTLSCTEETKLHVILF